MTQEERLIFCGKCTRRRADYYHEYICGLTRLPADFEKSCDQFELDVQHAMEIELAEIQAKKNKKLNRIFAGIGILVALGILSWYGHRVYQDHRQEARFRTSVPAFVQRIESTMNNGKSSLLDNAIDNQLMLEKHLPRNAQTENIFQQVAGDPNFMIGVQLLPYIRDQGYFKFLSLAEREGKYYAMYRMYSDVMGLNYLELEIVNSHGEPKISDIYSFGLGKHMSVLLFNSTPKQDNSGGEMLNGGYSRYDYQYFINLMEKASELKKAGKYKEALGKLEETPRSLRHDPRFIATRMGLERLVSDSLYRNSLLQVLQDHAHDSIQYAFYQFISAFPLEKWDDVLMAKSKLQKIVGDDSVFFLYSCHAHLQLKQYDSALVHANNALKAFPLHPSSVSVKMETLLYMQKFDEAFEVMQVFQQQNPENSWYWDMYLSNFPGAMKNEQISRWMEKKYAAENDLE